MQAVCVEQAGWPNALPVRERPVPDVGDDDVLVRVHAAGMNFADMLLIDGSYQEQVSLPFVPGAELCGTVLAVGSNVDASWCGERIMGQVLSGAYAEYAVVHQHRLARVPHNMPSDVAAGFYIPYGTALCALQHRGRVKPGESVLVLGAAGAVGLAAVQVAKALGARVIAAAAGHKLDQTAAAGADVSIAYDTGDLRQAVLDATDGQGVDVVFDPVGGAVSEQALRCLRFEGRLIVIGFTSGQPPALRSNHILVKNIDIVGCYWGPYQTQRAADTQAAFVTLANWYDQGLLRPHIADHVSLQDVSRALQGLVNRQYAGKVIVNIDPSLKGETA
nr:NADPH:quinone oxidoreductase family protein [Pseudomonas sp.]